MIAFVLLAMFALPGEISAAEQIPFESPLNTAEDFARWTTYDMDKNLQGEKANWFLGNTDMGGDCAVSWADVSAYTAVDNWLISPALALETGKKYFLKYKYYTAYYQDEYLNVYISRSADPTQNPTLLKEMTLRNYYGGDEKIEFPAIEESGDYYIMFRHTTKGNNGVLVGIKDLSVTFANEGNLNGKAQDYYGKPAAGLSLTLSGTQGQEFTFTTGSDGRYEFNNVPADVYSLKYEKIGVKSNTIHPVEVKTGETTVRDFYVTLMSTYTVTGKITDNADTPISGAIVRLSGYASFEAVTNESGDFEIPGVYEWSDSWRDPSVYNVTITKNGFVSVSEQKGIDYYGANFGTVKLTYNNIAPYSVEAEEAGSNVNVSWVRPVDEVELAFDNGIPADALGYDDGRETSIVGTVFHTPMTLNRVKWYRIYDPQGVMPPDKVYLYVIGLDDNGDPDPTNILLTKSDIYSPLSDWTVMEFDEPINAPKGCLVALSAIGHVSLARDNSDEVAPARTQLYSNTYNGGYRYFEDNGWKGALMVRAEGEVIEQGSFVPNVKYNVYRLNENKTDDRSSWTQVANAVDGLKYTDTGFASLARGSYRYAVEATYPVDNLVSEVEFSGVVHKDQHTIVTVNVTADSEPADAEGARIRLDDGNGHSYEVAVAGGKALFEKVWKQHYKVSAVQPGFTFAEQTADFSDAATYSYSMTLVQNIVPVNNIDVVNGDGGQTLVWDVYADINDDFEGEEYTDFEKNPAGRYGWTYVDNDGLPTYGFGSITFPGMKEASAAVLMNGATTEPAMEFNPARSGDRFLGFFACYPIQTEGGTMLRRSDDYLISPRLDFHKDFKFSFWAKTNESIEGRLETIRVGYSTTTDNLEDFTFVTDGYVEVPEEMEHFEYVIPAEARYVTLNNSSDDVFLLAVDDISLSTGIPHSGKPASAGSFKGYKVYLDGQLMETLTANSYKLPALSDGRHTAEVSKLYNSGESEKLAIEFDAKAGAISNLSVTGDVEIMLTADNNLLILGSYTTASVYSVDGRMVKNGITGNAPVALDFATPGVYVVKAMCPDGNAVTSKIVVR